jgi:rhamnosyltransferase
MPEAGVVVVAVVAAYRPGPEVGATLDALCAQCDAVIVVDDGSHTLDPAAPPREGVEVISLAENGGIAAALNAGIRRASFRHPGCCVVTMDQDSIMSEGYVPAAVTTLKAARRAGVRVGSVCAQTHNGHPVKAMHTRPRGFALAFDPMQSGTLIPPETIDAIGLLEEDFVIDAVDTEFNLRMLDAGLAQVIAPGCDLQHRLGDARPMTFFGWNPRLRGTPLRIYYHSPYRTYFITRNNIVLWRRYTRRFPRWIARRATMEFQSAAVCLAFGPARGRHARAMLAGIGHALSGRLGPMSARLRSRLS